MDELLDELRAMRVTVVVSMVGELRRDNAWAQWMPLLAQVQAAITAVVELQAIEAGGEDCTGGVPQAAQSARGA